jgi:hypothetical protein
MEGTINNTYLIQYIVYVTDNFQSCDLVFSLCILMGGETKLNIEALQLLVDKLNGFAEDVTSIHPDYLLLVVTHKADMSAGWKLTKKGGAYKVNTNLCMYCPCWSDNVHEPVSHCDDCNALQTDQYIWGASDDKVCYHYNLVDDLELKKIYDRSSEIMKMINVYTAECLKSSTINLLDVADFDQGGTNIQSINYAPPQPRDVFKVL